MFIRTPAIEDPEVQRLIAKLGVFGALVALAVFTGSRARDHREREKNSGTKEMELRAFDPFIESLPPREKVRERILMTRRFFARDGAGPDPQVDVELLSTDDEVAASVRELPEPEAA